MALWSTWLLTETSTRNFRGGKGWLTISPLLRVDRLFYLRWATINFSWRTLLREFVILTTRINFKICFKLLSHVSFSVYQTTCFQWFSFAITFTGTVSQLQPHVQRMATSFTILTIRAQGQMYILRRTSHYILYFPCISARISQGKIKFGYAFYYSVQNLLTSSLQSTNINV
jgi:hypothetical protein